MADWTNTSPADLLRAHLARTPNTARAYNADMATFTRYLTLDIPAEAVDYLVGLTRGAAKRVLDGYVTWLRSRYSLNSARRKIQSLVGLLRLAHEYEIIPWAIFRMPMPAAASIRDTRGPSREDMLAMVEVSEQRGDAKGVRDAALIRMMGVCALRSNEVRSLDVKHVDIDAREVEILGKGLWGTARNRCPIDIRTADAVSRWITDFRGDEDGPLFTTCCYSKARAGKRLTPRGLYDVVHVLGNKVGIDCHPHGLRHTAATEFLRLSGGNISWAMALTRHRDPRTLMIYNDERMIRAREAMEIVAQGIPVHRYDPPENPA